MILSQYHIFELDTINIYSVEVTVNSKEENSQDFCPHYVQEFGLRQQCSVGPS